MFAEGGAMFLNVTLNNSGGALFVLTLVAGSIAGRATTYLIRGTRHRK